MKKFAIKYIILAVFLFIGVLNDKTYTFLDSVEIILVGPFMLMAFWKIVKLFFGSSSREYTPAEQVARAFDNATKKQAVKELNERINKFCNSYIGRSVSAHYSYGRVTSYHSNIAHPTLADYTRFATAMSVANSMGIPNDFDQEIEDITRKLGL